MPYLSNPNSMTGGPFGTTAATTNTGFFTDNTNPSSVNCNALPEPSSNVIAASGKWTGGRRGTKRDTNKTYNSKCQACINRRKKDRNSYATRRRWWRNRNKHRLVARSKNSPFIGRRSSKRKRGGTTNNVPNTPSYATGTALPYNLSALANPVPYWKLDNGTNCADNYNHFTGGRKRRKTRRKTRRKKRSGKKRSGKKRSGKNKKRTKGG